MSEETPEYDSIEYPELQNGWSWWSGNTSTSYYTRWFGTNYQMGGPHAGEYGLGGFEGEIYWDKGGDHHVEMWYIQSIDDNGDPLTSYPVVSRSFDSMQEAVNAIPELIESL